MVKLVGRKIKFEFHETAWSLRTSGFPIWGVRRLPNGKYEFTRIASTQKKPFTIEISDFVAVVRYYQSNSGYVTFYAYWVENGKLRVEEFRETENFEPWESVPLFVEEAVGKLVDKLIENRVNAKILFYNQKQFIL